MDTSNIIYDQFKEMENRYHTWMNYYSLFNGALLVAYCSILVSTGQVIEMGGGISTENGITGNARLFQLECTYWNILALIAFLGCVASYCWYLSAIGHYHWIGCWRRKLLKTETNLSFNSKDNKDRAIHYHSTYKITRRFIATVLLAWIFVCYSSITRDYFQLDFCKILSVLVIGIILFIFELLMHFMVGSNLSNIGNQSNEDEILIDETKEALKTKIIDIILGFTFLIMFGLIFYYFCYKKEIENQQQIKIKVEMVKPISSSLYSQ